MEPIQMQLSQNQNIFAGSFSAFHKPISSLEHFKKEDDPQRVFVSEIIDWKKGG